MKDIIKANIYYVYKDLKRNVLIYALIANTVMDLFVIKEFLVPDCSVEFFLDLYAKLSVVLMFVISGFAVSCLKNFTAKRFLEMEITKVGSRRKVIFACLLEVMGISMILYFIIAISAFLVCTYENGKSMAGISVILLVRYALIKMLALIKYTIIFFAVGFLSAPKIVKMLFSSFMVVYFILIGVKLLINENGSFSQFLWVYTSPFQCIASVEKCARINLGFAITISVAEMAVFLTALIKRFEKQDLSEFSRKEE